MSDHNRANDIGGKTIRWIWTEGPTKGKTHEHVFDEDGTVTWRAIDETGNSHLSKPTKYAAFKVNDDVSVVSYLADSGYTLTVVMNYADESIVGFASGAKEWYPVQGRFQVVNTATR